MTMTYELQQARRYQTPSYTPARITNTEAAAVAHPKTPLSKLAGAVLVMVIIVAAVVGFGSDAAASGPIEAVSETSVVSDTIEVYIVQLGDTLWDIAGEIALPGEDVRPLVDALQESTNGSALDVGQRLVIDHVTIRG